MNETPTRYEAGTRTASPTVVYVGIDPGAETGVAVWSPALGALLHVGSGSFWAAVRLLDGRTDPSGAVGRSGCWQVAGVVVEDARGLPIYARNRGGSRGEAARIARSVGRVDREVDLWQSWLGAGGYTVRLSAPQRRKKWDDATMKRLTGWTEATNEHGRDAARLVFGLSASASATWGQPP